MGGLGSSNFVRAIVGVDNFIYWSQEGCVDLYKITPHGAAQASPVRRTAAAFLLANPTHIFIATGYEFVSFPR